MTLKKIFVEILMPFFLDLIFPRDEIVQRIEKMSGREALDCLPKCSDKTGLIPEMRDMTVIFKYRHRAVRQMVWELKYRGNKKVARLCGEILSEVILHGEKFCVLPAVLIPVPLARERRRERGFNQNELVIKEMIFAQNGGHEKETLSGVLDVFSFSFDALVKIRPTLPQSSIKNRAQRLKNLSGCFTVPQPEKVRGKNIILIDDVTTTGSTLAAPRAVLYRAGARTVSCIAIAH